MEGCSLDGFCGKLQLVSADDIKLVYALESQSTFSFFSVSLYVHCAAFDRYFYSDVL